MFILMRKRKRTLTMVTAGAIIALPSPLFMAFIFAIIMFLIYNWKFFQTDDAMPVAYYKESALATHIMKKCKQLCQPFKPTLWIRNKHIQTLLTPWLSNSQVQYEREYLQMRDRGIVSVDWASLRDRRIRESNTVFIIIPDVARDATSVSRLTKHATDRGFRVAVFNRRGHANSFLTSPKLQGFGDPTDLRQVVKYIRGVYSRANLVAVAMGTGSGLLLSYLGEYGSSAHLAASVCVSACYEAQELLGKDIKNIYDFFYLLRQKRALSPHVPALTGHLDLLSLFNSWTFRDFDERLYCKMYGHKSIDDYWERNNPMRDADDIAVPLLCINSLDDPMFPKSNIPYDLFKCYPNLFLVVTERGGHCGFIENLTTAVSWAECLTIRYIEAVLDAQLKIK
ncbi:protein ABHD15-like [Octopus sinensis]|uniref:Protein ABHD15-like n=1 Tax=Octopus sinensis TaxID=2607531 RepID=A0A6P7SJD1_9MOLL|nr:protein ABHD15-like [Octopus sinensis]